MSLHTKPKRRFVVMVKAASSHHRGSVWYVEAVSQGEAERALRDTLRRRGMTKARPVMFLKDVTDECEFKGPTVRLWSVD